MAGFRELIVKIGADAGGLDGVLGSIIPKLGALGTVASVAGPAAAAAIAAIGAAAFKTGLDFEASSRTIRAGTGATGEALKGLEASAKAVYGSVDDSLSDVSRTLADLNTATGATGPTLENLTRQMLDLKDLGVGFSGEIQNLTRVYGDWGIAIEDAAQANDYLFKVAQATGAGVDDLAQKVVQFGAPLRQLGFDFESAAALMGKWQKEGVNTETVMAGLRVGLANLSQAGGDVPANFRAALESIKSAGSEAQANSIAFEIFGKRAGPDLAAAVREGRFDIDELTQALDVSGDTIGSVAEETETLGEKISTMSNKAMVALEPLGTFIVDVLGSALDDGMAMWDAYGIMLDQFAELAAMAGVKLWDFSEGVQGVGHSIRDFFIGYFIKANEAMIAFAKMLDGIPFVKFDASISVMEKTVEKLKGTLKESSDTVGSGTSPKPSSFSGSLAGATAKAFDLEKALKAAADEAEKFEKGIKEARDRGAEEFTKSVEAMGSALDDSKMASANAARGITADMQRVFDAVQAPLTPLSEIPTKTKDVADAFASLQTKGTAELQRLYAEAERNFDLIQDSGEATPKQISEAWRNELEAQKALLVSQGKDLSEEEQKILDDLNAKLETGTQKMQGTWTEFAGNVSATIAGLGSKLFSDLLESKFSLDNVWNALSSIKDAFADALFKPVATAIDNFIANSIDKLLGKLTGPDGISGALDKVFGSVGSSGSPGGVPDVPGAGGGSGGASSAAASGFLGWANFAANVGSMISGIIGNFQNARQETTLNAIEENTRISAIHLGYILGTVNDEFHRNVVSRHGDLKTHLQMLSDRESSDNTRLLDGLNGIRSEAPAIRNSIESGSNQMLQELGRLASTVERLADRPIQVSVSIDDEAVGAAAARYLDRQF